MPLADLSTLVNEILSFSDESNGSFKGFPVDEQQTADYWADAFVAWLSTAVVPPGLGAVLAKPAMVAAMVALAVPNPSGDGSLFYPPGAGALALGNGLAALVAGASAIPAVTVPPPALFVPPPLPPVTDPSVPALAIATAALAWASTGTHVPPPGTAPPVPWS